MSGSGIFRAAPSASAACARATARWTAGRPASSRRCAAGAPRSIDRCEVVALRGAAGRVDARRGAPRRRDAAVQGAAGGARSRRAELAAAPARLRRRALAGGLRQRLGPGRAEPDVSPQRALRLLAAGPDRDDAAVRGGVAAGFLPARRGAFRPRACHGAACRLRHHPPPAAPAVRRLARRAGAAGSDRCSGSRRSRRHGFSATRISSWACSRTCRCRRTA